MNEQLIEKAEVFEDLLKHPGWEIFKSDVETMINDTTLEVLEDEENPMIFKRGIVQGMKRLLCYPHERIEEALKTKGR